MEIAGAYVELWPGDPGNPERPLLNHLGVLVKSAEEWQARAEAAGRRSRRRHRCAEHVRGVRVGPRAREARVRRAQARLLARVTVVVAGAGMAGLVAAARLGELGRHVTVREKGTRPGGSMLLSSGVIWRHRTLEDFRAECPAGYPELQQLIVDQLDDRLDWLESLGRPGRAPRDGESAHGRAAVQPARPRSRAAAACGRRPARRAGRRGDRRAAGARDGRLRRGPRAAPVAPAAGEPVERG